MWSKAAVRFSTNFPNCCLPFALKRLQKKIYLVMGLLDDGNGASITRMPIGTAGLRDAGPHHGLRNVPSRIANSCRKTCIASLQASHSR